MKKISLLRDVFWKAPKKEMFVLDNGSISRMDTNMTQIQI